LGFSVSFFCKALGILFPRAPGSGIADSSTELLKKNEQRDDISFFLSNGEGTGGSKLWRLPTHLVVEISLSLPFPSLSTIGS